jgi:hypothetical protein
MNIYVQTDTSNILNIAAGSNNATIDSESFYESVDLLSEGPIEGLTDSNGNTVNYITLNNSSSNPVNSANSSLAYGVYYNDVSVKDSKSNLFNVTSSDFNLHLGNSLKNSDLNASSLYEYKSRVYDLERDPSLNFDITKNYDTKLFYENSTDTDFQKKLIALKDTARCFTHYVKNKYTTTIILNISIDLLYYIGGKGETYSNYVRFVVALNNPQTRKTAFLYFQGYFVVKSTPIIIPIILEISDEDRANNPFSEFIISVYSVQQRISAIQELKNAGNASRNFSVDSVIEQINYGFSNPYSVLCRNKVSARHFGSIPVRSYDCKLLKIRVPDNYDCEAREYSGDWSGNFSKTLKWSDNPAWIFYDLCVNSRYGLAKTFFNENDLNKWELLKISKYCDELVKTNASTKYPYDNFTYDNDLTDINSVDYNTIIITRATAINQTQLSLEYPIGSLLFLYDIKDQFDENVDTNYKKIIVSATVTSTYKAKIKLYNDFGPRTFIESDKSGKFFSALQSYVSGNPSILNRQDKIKKYAVSYISRTDNIVLSYNSAEEQISEQYSSAKIFDYDLKIKSGKCVAAQEGFGDFLEPRFSANILLNSETESLKVLSDLSSVFRGIFYFRNGYLSLSSDVSAPTSYIFTNSNVKDGLFTYTSSDFNTSFSIAKVSYLDKSDNFKDKIVYVEDSDLIKKYGLIEKEVIGFGVTSRYQANRIGKWFLATGKLESEVVSFTTGIEANLLKIGDVVRVADYLKTSNISYGKITSLDFKNNYIYTDRPIPDDSLGKNIKIFSVVQGEPIELSFYISEIDNANLRLKLINEKYFSWVLKSGITASSDNKILTAISSFASDWNKKAYTNQPYTDNCSLDFSVPDLSSESAVGISEIDNINNSYTDIDYCFRFAGSGVVVEVNNSIVASGSFKITDSFSITYDGTDIKFYQNNTLLYTEGRTKGNPLYAIVAMKTIYASIKDLYYTSFPDETYGNYANLRSDANFAIYLEENIDKQNLYRISSITENSANDYAISALKYDEEKFKIVEDDKYVDPNQNNQKQIVFSTDDYITSALTDDQIIANITNPPLDISYVQSINTVYDYSFIIENEVLNANYNLKMYQSISINFVNLFTYLTNPLVNGLLCNITRNGKILKFKVLRSEARFVNIFLGEKPISSGNYSPSYFIDFYAFDKNLKLINV